MNMNCYSIIICIDKSLVKLEIREPSLIFDVMHNCCLRSREWELTKLTQMFLVYIVSEVLDIFRHLFHFTTQKCCIIVNRASETVPPKTFQMIVMCMASGDAALVHK